MAQQNINQYNFNKWYIKPVRKIFDISLVSDERDYNEEVIFSTNLIAQNDGNRLPIYFDLNNPLSSQQLNLDYGSFISANTLVSLNYYNPESVDLNCLTASTVCDIGLTGMDNALVPEMSGETITYTMGLFTGVTKWDRYHFDRRFKMIGVSAYTQTGVDLLLQTTYSAGSIVTNYELVSDKDIIDNLEISFTNTLGFNDGNSIAISTGVTINNGENAGTTTVVIPYSFDDLNGTSEFSNFQSSNPKYQIKITPQVIFETQTPTPTNTPTPSFTPTQTPTPSFTPTQTPTPSFTPTQTPTPSSTPTPAFISIWRTTLNNEEIQLPYVPPKGGGIYNGTINWGDGTITTNSYANRTHIYSTPGDYTIIITGVVIGFVFENTGSRSNLIEITQWGCLRLNSQFQGGYFSGCNNLKLNNVNDILNLDGVISLYEMFNGCTSLGAIARINEWDVSNITDMSRMFLGAINFNTYLGNWNTSSVLSMVAMFSGATSYQMTIGSWNVSGVTDMSNMLDYCGIGLKAYNDILVSWIGWDGLQATKTVQSNVTLGAVGRQYTNSGNSLAARNYLVNTKGWIITGDIPV